MTTPTPPSNARYWVKNEHGRIWGPFGLDTIGRVDLGKVDFLTRIHVSTDGRKFSPLAEFPEVLKAIERAVANAPPPRRLTVEVDVPPPPPPPVAARPAAPPPPPAPAEKIGPPEAGTLLERSTLAIYSAIAHPSLTGRLTLDLSEGEWIAYFKKGTVHRVEAPRGAELFAAWLVRRNAAPVMQIHNALEISGGPEGDFVDAIFALNLVPAGDVFRMLGEFAGELLERFLAFEEGAFRWEDGVVPPPASFALGQKWQLVSDWIRKQPAATLRRRLGARAYCAVYRSGTPGRVSLEDLRLSAQETRLLSLFDGTRSPDRIAQDLPGDSEIALRTALLLGDLGVLSFGPDLREAARAPEGPAPVRDDDAPALEKVSAGDDGKPTDATGEGLGLGKVAVKSVAVRASPKTPPPLDALFEMTPPPAAPDRPLVMTPDPPKPPDPPKAPLRPPPPLAKPVDPPKPVEPPKPPPPRPPPPVASRPPPTRAPPPVMATAAHVAKAEPAAPADPVETVPGARELLAKWKKATHFEVLGITEKSPAADIKTAYFALARRLHPDTVTDPALAELKALKAELISRVNEANAVLTDDKARAEYLSDLAGGEKVDIGPILQAEEDFLRATILVKARKYAEALALLEKAIAANANEGEFYAWRAWARFTQAKDKRLIFDESVAECARALKLSPVCAAAHLFTGHMAKIVGDTARARKAYEACLALEPNNAEAKSELRLFNARKQ